MSKLANTETLTTLRTASEIEAERLAGKREIALDALAKLFSGAAVVHHSIGLSMGSTHTVVAKAFFDTRESCGVRGYDDVLAARAALDRLFK